MAEFFPFPAWFYILTCGVALLVGLGIRRYLDRRQMKKREQAKMEMKELKKEQKRHRKQIKKARKK